MRVAGIATATIANVFKVTEKTLNLRCRQELATGLALANTRIAKALYEIALGSTGDPRAQVTAAICWTKCRAGWHEGAERAAGAPGEQLYEAMERPQAAGGSRMTQSAISSHGSSE